MRQDQLEGLTRRWARASAVLVAVAAAAWSTPAAIAHASPDGGRHAEPANLSSALGLQWYDISSRTVAAAAFAEPVTQSRTWAVSWLAASHALRFGSNSAFDSAAFATALHDTLAAQVPSQQAALDADLTATLSTIPNGPAKSRGMAAGQREAAAELAERSGDGLDTASVDTPWSPPAPGPGTYQFTPPTFGPAIRAGQGNARSFLLSANDQFDPGPPPSLTSQTYLDSLAEVRSVGSATSAIRTTEQTDIAKFWEPASNVLYVQVVRGALARATRPLAWQARFVAAFNVVTTDAQIAIFNAKYKYTFWRPVTAIREGDVDPDPTWTPFFATPRHPEYPSGHGGYAGAAQRVLAAFYGRRTPAPISVTSPADPGVTHVYNDWRTITQENIDGRVWEGIHYRFSDTTGVDVGEQTARYDLERLGHLGL